MTKNEVDNQMKKEEISHDHLFRVTGLSSTDLEKMGQVEVPPSDFEAAIEATGYGRFNLLLMLCTLPAFWSAVSVTSASSYIFARAQCDMKLTFIDMGTLNAITYGGMISSAMLWGFLSDTLGRRRIMIWGFLTAGLVDICASMSQNFTMLLITRFTCGFVFNGPFAVLISYLAELHRTELRARVILLTSMFYTIASTTLPLLAWGVMTQDHDIYFFGNTFVIHSWNLFLLSAACVPVLTGFAFFCMPESPKFLMSRGRNDEAMQIFRKIYAMNTGKPGEEFPITALQEEKTQRSATGMAALKAGGQQIAPLFFPPHLPWLLLMCVTNMGLMLGTNSIRLWYPQLAAIIGHSNASLCSALAPSALPVPDDSCIPLETDMLTYLQSAVVGVGSVLTYGIGGVLVNRCGKKIVAGVCGLLAGAAVLSIPFLQSGPFFVTAMVTASLALTSLCQASMSSIVVDLFPTSLRAMTMSCFFMTGRLGTITGTIAFPALINYGCLPPFITIAAVLALIGLASFCLPNTNLKKLE